MSRAAPPIPQTHKSMNQGQLLDEIAFFTGLLHAYKTMPKSLQITEGKVTELEELLKLRKLTDLLEGS